MSHYRDQLGQAAQCKDGQAPEDAGGEQAWKRLADFLFEVGMLKKTPRTGYQFLGSGGESVAEHSFRTTIIGYLLAVRSEADWARVVLMCLFHDLHEARVGDFNYVNRMYNTAHENRAFRDAVAGTGLESDLGELMQELDEVRTREASLAQDADQLDLILSLKEEQDLGNPYAPKWLEYALQRLRTKWGRELASSILATDHTDWWFKEADHTWWTRSNGQR